MNLFRVPLNVLVVLILIFVERFANHTVFLICTFWLAAGAGAAYKLSSVISAAAPPPVVAEQQQATEHGEAEAEHHEKRNGNGNH